MDVTATDATRDDGSQEAGGRPPGRPRDPDIEPRVLRAAADVFGEAGYEGASIAAISERSGAGKPSIYLRWHNRRALFLDCIRAVGPPPPAPPPGASLAEDLARWSDAAAAALCGDDRGVIRAALFTGADDAEVAAALEEALLGPLTEGLTEVIGRWPEPGGDVSDDPGAVADLLLAPLLQAAVTGRRPQGLPTAADVVARSLAGRPAA
jgi:AcrR family transcriptional regulator